MHHAYKDMAEKWVQGNVGRQFADEHPHLRAAPQDIQLGLLVLLVEGVREVRDELAFMNRESRESEERGLAERNLEIDRRRTRQARRLLGVILPYDTRHPLYATEPSILNEAVWQKIRKCMVISSRKRRRQSIRALYDGLRSPDFNVATLPGIGPKRKAQIEEYFT